MSHLNGLLIVAFSVISIVPPYAQAQQPDTAKLKADAQKVISSISIDKAKIEAYCEVTNLGGQAVEAAQEKNEKKADALMQRIDDLEKILGPEYPALFNALYDADPNSKDVQDILSMFAMLDQSCPD
jgi:hypothetical protein